MGYLTVRCPVCEVPQRAQEGSIGHLWQCRSCGHQSTLVNGQGRNWLWTMLLYCFGWPLLCMIWVCKSRKRMAWTGGILLALFVLGLILPKNNATAPQNVKSAKTPRRP